MQAAPKIDNNITVIDGYNITFVIVFMVKFGFFILQRLWNAV